MAEIYTQVLVRPGEHAIIFRGSGPDLVTDIVPHLIGHERLKFLLALSKYLQEWGLTFPKPDE